MTPDPATPSKQPMGERRPFQFSLRALFRLVFVVAALCSLVKWFGQLYFLRLFAHALNLPYGELFVPAVFAVACTLGAWLLARRLNLSPQGLKGRVLVGGLLLLNLSACGYVAWAHHRLTRCLPEMDESAPWPHPDRALFDLWDCLEARDPTPPLSYHGKLPLIRFILGGTACLFTGGAGLCVGVLTACVPRKRPRRPGEAFGHAPQRSALFRCTRWAARVVLLLVAGAILWRMEIVRRHWADKDRWAEAGAHAEYEEGRLVGLYFNTRLFSNMRYYGTDKLDDEYLNCLRELTDLESLMLPDSRITDAGLERLSHLTKLAWLDIDGSRVTDAGLGRLKQFYRLRKLDLSRTAVSDRGVPALLDLPALDTLTLDETKITDAGVSCLARLTRLRYLSIRNTQISDRGAWALQNALPECSIYR